MHGTYMTYIHTYIHTYVTAGTTPFISLLVQPLPPPPFSYLHLFLLLVENLLQMFLQQEVEELMMHPRTCNNKKYCKNYVY